MVVARKSTETSLHSAGPATVFLPQVQTVHGVGPRAAVLPPVPTVCPVSSFPCLLCQYLSL